MSSVCLCYTIGCAIHPTHVLLERWAFDIKKCGEKKVASTLCESEKSDVCMFVVDFPCVWANECSDPQEC